MLTVTTQTIAPKLHMPWKNAIAVGRAYEILRQDVQDHLALLQREIGFRYCRFHAVFHEDMQVVVRRPDGRLGFQWHHVDKVYDALRKLGLRPFVELNPMPKVMASGTQEMFYWKMNVTPPTSYDEWSELVEAFARHMIDRYGLDEVRQWYFEVWNEPNLSCFWSADMAEYFKLYDASAKALKKVDPQLRVGGPASSKANWIQEIIDHCITAKVPIDFVSTHVYPQDEFVEFKDRASSPHVPGEFFADTIQGVQKTVRASALPKLEIHWTEWNPMSATSAADVQWITNITNDSLYGASFIAQNMTKLDQAADTFCFWIASDFFEESGTPHAPFTCTYGMVNLQGIPKASFNAFKLLNQMRGQVLQTQVAKAPSGCGGCVTQEDGIWNVLLWNHRLLETKDQPDWKDHLEITLPDSSQRRVVSMCIRQGAGSAYETWDAMGRPHNLAPTEEALLKAHSVPQHSVQVIAPTQKKLSVPFELGPNQVLYMQIRPMGQTVMPKGANPNDQAAWDLAMGEQSR